MAKPNKKYKYIRHILTKQLIHNELLGLNWSKYLYSNLTGNKGVIIKILNDFEKNEKL